MDRNKYHIGYMALAALLLAVTGCYKDLLPEEKDFLSNNINFGRDKYEVNLGRTNVFIGDFNPDYSTQPLTFTIENVRRQDSSAAPELTEQVDTWQWQSYYTGSEKTIEEIYSKRKQEKRPALDIRPNSGDVIFWNTDSARIKPGLYTFDIRVKNKGGEKLFRKRILDVRRPRPYDPYEFDDITGQRKKAEDGGILHPSVIGVRDSLNNEIKKEDVTVYFHKVNSNGNSITFKFFDKDSLPIPVSRFNTMRWDSLFYRSATAEAWVRFGFNRQITKDSIVAKYDITNPFPVLADVGLSSERAGIAFVYTRISYGIRQTAGILFDFAIYEPGNWEIIYKFRVNPKFTDD